MQTLSHPYLLPVVRADTRPAETQAPDPKAQTLVRLFQVFELADLRHQIATVSAITSVVSSMTATGQRNGRRFKRLPSSFFRCGPLFTKHARYPSHLEDLLSSPTARNFSIGTVNRNPSTPNAPRDGNGGAKTHTPEAHPGMTSAALSLLLSWKLPVRPLSPLRTETDLVTSLADPKAHALRRLIMLLALEAADEASADPHLNKTWRNLTASGAPMNPLLEMAHLLRHHVKDTVLAPGMSITWSTEARPGSAASEADIKALLFMPLIPPAHAGGSTARMPTVESSFERPEFDIKPFYLYEDENVSTRQAPGITPGRRKPLSAVTLSENNADPLLRQNLGVFAPIEGLTLDSIYTRAPARKILSLEAQFYLRTNTALWKKTAQPKWFEIGFRERRAKDSRQNPTVRERAMHWGLHPIPTRAGRNIPSLPVEDRLAGQRWIAQQTAMPLGDLLCVTAAPIKSHNHVAIDSANRGGAHAALDQAAAVTWSFTSLLVLASAEAFMRDPMLQLRLSRATGIAAVVTSIGELEAAAAGEVDSAALLAQPGQGRRLTRLVEGMDHRLGSSLYTLPQDAVSNGDVDMAAEGEGLSGAGLSAGNREYALGAAWEVLLSQPEALFVAMDTGVLSLPTEENMLNYVQRMRGITPPPHYGEDDRMEIEALKLRVDVFTQFSHNVTPAQTHRMAPATLYGVEMPATTCVPTWLPHDIACRLAVCALEAMEHGATAHARSTLNTLVKSAADPRAFLAQTDEAAPALQRTALLQALRDFCYVDEKGQTLFSVLVNRDHAFFGPTVRGGAAETRKRAGMSAPGPMTTRRAVRPHEVTLLKDLHERSLALSKGEITLEQVLEPLHPWPEDTLDMVDIILRMVINASSNNLLALDSYMPWAPTAEDISKALHPEQEVRQLRHVLSDMFNWKRR